MLSPSSRNHEYHRSFDPSAFSVMQPSSTISGGLKSVPNPSPESLLSSLKSAASSLDEYLLKDSRFPDLEFLFSGMGRTL